MWKTKRKKEGKYGRSGNILYEEEPGTTTAQRKKSGWKTTAKSCSQTQRQTSVIEDANDLAVFIVASFTKDFFFILVLKSLVMPLLNKYKHIVIRGT